MKINEAIQRIDALKPNGYTQEEKVDWLSKLDGMIKRTVLDNYEEKVEFTPYTPDTPLSTELLIGEPYDEMYVLWLESRIDYANGEIGKYNNSSIRFNSVFTDFSNDYNRNHTHKQCRIKYW